MSSFIHYSPFFLYKQSAGINRREALTIGIPVDHRRKNRSVESLELNVARLKTYKSKLIIFPKKSGKSKKDSDPTELAQAKQIKGPVLAIEQTWVTENPRKVTEEEKKFDAYSTLRRARADARFVGVREMRRKAKEEEEANKKKQKKVGREKEAIDCQRLYCILHSTAFGSWK